MEVLSKIAQAFEHGGIWMWPILGMQMASIAIIAERVHALFVKRKLNQAEFAQNFEEPIRRGEIDHVIEKAQANSASEPIARAIFAGAKAAKFLGGKEEIQGKMDEVLIHENALIDRRTGFLTMIGNVSTLLGLLGTITGMIRSFAAVAYANPSEKAALLSAGISEAMNCTAYGLIVAIPALVLYGILQNRANQVSEDLNQGGLKAFNWLSFAYEPAGFQPLRGRLADKGGKELEINA
jgi:biopolymer transport protein ExbB/TolQ